MQSATLANRRSPSEGSSSINTLLIPTAYSSSQHINHQHASNSTGNGNNAIGVTTATNKRKQPRTSNACERCKARKQKCVALSPQLSLVAANGGDANVNDNSNNRAPCRNCHESMSQCVFGPKPQRSNKKARTEATARSSTTASANSAINSDSRSNTITPSTGTAAHSRPPAEEDSSSAHGGVQAWLTTRNNQHDEPNKSSYPYAGKHDDEEDNYAPSNQLEEVQEEDRHLPTDFNAFWSAMTQATGNAEPLPQDRAASASGPSHANLQHLSPVLSNATAGSSLLRGSGLAASERPSIGTTRQSPEHSSRHDTSNSFTQHAYDHEVQTKQAMSLLQDFNKGSARSSAGFQAVHKDSHHEEDIPALPSIHNESLLLRRNQYTDLRSQDHSTASASIFAPSSRVSDVHSTMDKLPPMPRPTPLASTSSQLHPAAQVHKAAQPQSQTHLLPQTRHQYTSPTDSVASSMATSAETETSIEESAARGVAYISLEAAAEGHYVGQSSGATWASLILNGISASNSIVPRIELRSELHDKKPSRVESDLRLPSAVAAFVLETVYRHIQPRYPFVDWIVLHNHWQDRDKYIHAASEHRKLDIDEASIAFLILVTLAIGTQLCSRAEMRLPPSEEYYDLSMQYMDSIVQLHNLPNVQALLLLAMYSLHDSKGPSVWYLSGVAIRLCIGMGLHRRASPLQERTLSRYTLEMRKRIFWTAYTLDRTMAMSLGRPPGIADADIDADLPNDVDCVDISQDPRKGITTSMTSSIHVIKLMRIHSKIQTTAYSVNQEHITKDSEIWGMLGLLDDWEKGIPEAAASKDCWKVPCCSQEWFRNKSAEARLYLLRPSLLGPNAAESPFLVRAAQSAAFIGNAQRRLHQQGQPLSSSALYTLFLAGLTLLYAVYIRPTLLPSKEVFQAVRAFSNTLFSYSQHLKTAEPLHNIFEELSLHCLERMNARPEHPQLAANAEEKSAPADWQQALFGTTNEINVATAGEFASLFESLGLPSGAGTQASDYELLPTNGTGTGLDMDPFLLDFSWSQPLDLDWNM